MKSSCVLLVLASVLVVGCAGSSPLAPDSVSGSNARSSASTSQSFFPPIDPEGISCPTDAPGLRASSIGARMDIEFAEVAGATAYEIEIMSYTGVTHRLEVPAPAYRAEWYGSPGLYRIRVRTINCGGVGNWSADVFHTLDDNTPPPVKPPQPPAPGPQCVVGGCEPPTPGPQCMVGGCEPPAPQCMVGGCQPPPPPCMVECES